MSDELQKDLQQVILCDMCTEEDRKPARKTCMKCEISMCVQHLQAHLTTPVLLQTHPLTEPTSACGTTKCPQHGKLLEYYCLDDMTSVCVSCAIEDQHRLHNMKTFSTAHKELMENLKAEQKALEVKTGDENLSLEKWEKSEGEKLSRSSVSLIDAVTQLRDRVLTSIRSSVSARMVSIKTSQSSMQAAQREKDTFRFLQMYSQVHQDLQKAKAVDLRKGLEPGSERDKIVQEIKQNGEQMVEQAETFCGSMLTLVDPENHQELFTTSLDLIFEPKVFGPSMSLSKDNRKVFYSNWMEHCSAMLVIRSIHPLPKYNRWLVSLSEEFDWTIGLCDKQSIRNLKSGPVYGLCCKDNQLSSLTTEYDDCCASSANTLLPHKNVVSTETKRQHRVSSALLTQQEGSEDEAVPQPQIVEVFWDFVASTLSFFRRSGQYEREEIITLTGSLNNWDLIPFVQLGKENVQNRPRQNCRCTCGNSFNMDRMFSYQGNCSCGEIIGGKCITEVVCELI